MIDKFKPFAKLVADAFQEIQKSANVFVVGITGDDLYTKYLAAYPEGTNPIFKKRTENDCSTCKQFIRRAGNVVSIDDVGNIYTAWDVAAETAAYPYREVAAALRNAVCSAPIVDIFRVKKDEGSFGAMQTHTLDAETKEPITWNHFHTGPIRAELKVASPGADCGAYRDRVATFERGLVELGPGAVEEVMGLIEENGLYKGEEFKGLVREFQKTQKVYREKGDTGKKEFVWTRVTPSLAHFRGSMIGTLVQDLTEGKDLDKAVESYEKKAAPTNYKRTSALITPAMVKTAMAKIAELDLEPALERRFARISDISVNDVLWVDGVAKVLMKGGLGDTLLQHAAKSAPKKDVEGEDIAIDDFVAKVLPTATGMEVLFKGAHIGNLMSLTAPVHPEVRQLFKWKNDFAWSYSGNVADSYLRKQVQALGGRVDGVLRFSHMWNHEKRNASLMDLHVFMPGWETHRDGCHVFMPGWETHRDGCHDHYPGGQRVGWNNRVDSISGGRQDVDYVNAAPEGYVPVENITFPSMETLKDGQYTFKIHNWKFREPTLGGFKAEIEFGGQVFQYDHPAPLKDKEWITLAVATLKNDVFTIEHKHPVGTASQEQWGLVTEQFVKVNAVTLSPNYWGGDATGNKHTFFFLDGCKSDEVTRGIYNEFLHSRLTEHRKVFEVIAEKTKCQPTEGQLSGLGFSSTKKDSFVVKVQQGKKQRTFNVKVGG